MCRPGRMVSEHLPAALPLQPWPQQRCRAHQCHAGPAGARSIQPGIFDGLPAAEHGSKGRGTAMCRVPVQRLDTGIGRRQPMCSSASRHLHSAAPTVAEHAGRQRGSQASSPEAFSWLCIRQHPSAAADSLRPSFLTPSPSLPAGAGYRADADNTFQVLLALLLSPTSSAALSAKPACRPQGPAPACRHELLTPSGTPSLQPPGATHNCPPCPCSCTPSARPAAAMHPPAQTAGWPSSSSVAPPPAPACPHMPKSLPSAAPLCALMAALQPATCCPRVGCA